MAGCCFDRQYIDLRYQFGNMMKFLKRVELKI